MDIKKNAEDYSDIKSMYSKKQLLNIIKQYNDIVVIKGASTKKKEELIDEILKHMHFDRLTGFTLKTKTGDTLLETDKATRKNKTKQSERLKKMFLDLLDNYNIDDDIKNLGNKFLGMWEYLEMKYKRDAYDLIKSQVKEEKKKEDIKEEEQKEEPPKKDSKEDKDKRIKEGIEDLIQNYNLHEQGETLANKFLENWDKYTLTEKKNIYRSLKDLIIKKK